MKMQSWRARGLFNFLYFGSGAFVLASIVNWYPNSAIAACLLAPLAVLLGALGAMGFMAVCDVPLATTSDEAFQLSPFCQKVIRKFALLVPLPAFVYYGLTIFGR